MELNQREKELLVMFGCRSRKLTCKRLLWACLFMTDTLSKAATYGLRCKIENLPSDIWYRKMYDNIKEDLAKEKLGGDAA